MDLEYEEQVRIRLKEFIKTTDKNLMFIYQQHDKNHLNITFNTIPKSSCSNKYWNKADWISWVKKIKQKWKDYSNNRHLLEPKLVYETLDDFILRRSIKIDNTRNFGTQLLEILSDIMILNKEKAEKSAKTKARNIQMEEANAKRLAEEAETKKRRKVETQTILAESGLSASELAFINKYK